MLSIQNFSKRYADVLILSIDNLSLRPGAYWIKGENGSGKTTLFKSISGMLPCDGLVSFDDGITLREHPLEYRRRVNYSEAEPLFPGFLTPRELIRFIGKAKGASESQQQLLLNHFGIEQFQDKPISACSSGMVKKVSLALAFLGTPKMIILDEPLITLDENSRKVLFNLLLQYIRDHQVIFLLSSHQLLEDSSIELNGTLLIQDKKLLPA